MSERLLPCPFCGSDDVDPEGWLTSEGVTGPACNVCSASAGSIKGKDNIASWNQRADLEVSDQMVEEAFWAFQEFNDEPCSEGAIRSALKAALSYKPNP